MPRVGFNWFRVFLTQQGRVINVANPAQDKVTDRCDDLLAVFYAAPLGFRVNAMVNPGRPTLLR